MFWNNLDQYVFAARKLISVISIQPHHPIKLFIFITTNIFFRWLFCISLG